MDTIKKKESGFTLVEAMVALLIFTIAMLYILPFFLYGHKHTVRADHVTFGLQVAKDTLEQYRSMDYSAIPVGTGVTLPTQAMNGIVFQPVVTVTENPNTWEAQYKEILVTVTWTVDEYNKSVNLRTQIAPMVD